MTIEEQYNMLSEEFVEALFETSACNSEVAVTLNSLVNFTEQTRYEALELLNLIANAYLMGAEIHDDH